MALTFNTRFDPRHGSTVEVGSGVKRLTAPNSGPYTFQGTNTYLIGTASLAIVDPGPDDTDHFDALTKAIGGRRVEAIILTHSHLDHTPLTARLKAHSGAPVYAAGPHRPYRDLSAEELALLGRSADLAFVPDRTLTDGQIIHGADWQLETVLTPGHTANHAAFAIAGTPMLISGDHVMGWSTTIVAPPDGSMADYLRSLDILLSRPEAHYLPGHGDAIANALPYVKGLKTHRIMRETAIYEQIANGTDSISDIVAALYRRVPAKLHGAAAMTVLAHLECLIASGKISSSDRPVTLQSKFRVADGR
uniref:MBL fold metallo-hydrolase n=1 Tax=Pararhizobium sp. IMCC3301 TaxID=3067904 RepID=UPI0027427985|nr:MBL fold metallo-hydrolase [Pararhizobium sp. IMCC3301]